MGYNHPWRQRPAPRGRLRRRPCQARCLDRGDHGADHRGGDGRSGPAGWTPLRNAGGAAGGADRGSRRCPREPPGRCNSAAAAPGAHRSPRRRVSLSSCRHRKSIDGLLVDLPPCHASLGRPLPGRSNHRTEPKFRRQAGRLHPDYGRQVPTAAALIGGIPRRRCRAGCRVARRRDRRSRAWGASLLGTKGGCQPSTITPCHRNRVLVSAMFVPRPALMTLRVGHQRTES